MRIGIISMQRLFNYGSFLQAYGLKNLLTELGHEVEFIDAKLADGTFLNIPPKRTLEYYCRNIIRKLTRPKLYNLSVKRSNDFLYKYFPVLGLTNTPNSNTNYDAVIIGSDEVFSYCQFIKWGGTTMYFGDNIESSKIISYAGSFGYTTYDELKISGILDHLGELLRRFTAISVRDENSRQIIVKLLGSEPYVHLDPVMIYNFEHVVPKKCKYKNYILIYGYDNRLTEHEYVSQIKAFAKENSKIIIGAGVYHDWCDVNISVDPFELLACVINADYVVSETFHGTVFSIKYQKNFAVVVRDSNREKLGDLLNRFGLQGKILSPDNNLKQVFSFQYSKEKVEQMISFEIRKTQEYFKKYLKVDQV